MEKNWNGISYIPDENPNIDALVRQRVMQDVWYRLEHLFPMIKANSGGVWMARRDASIVRTINGDDRFESIRNPLGPQNKQEWVLLAQACIEAMYGIQVTESELNEYKYLGKYQPYRLHNAWVEAQKAH